MRYLKVFTDFSASIECLGDAEKGRLFMAMLKYAETSEEPDLGGNERFLWGTAKLHIDRERIFAEKQRKNALAKLSQIKPNEAKLSQTSQKDKDKEKDKEYKEKNISKEIEKKKFLAPSVEQVRAYCHERKNGVDADRFVDYYSANGWKVGKNAMRDWKAAVRTWEKSETKPVIKQVAQNTASAEDIERMKRLIQTL